MKTNRSLMYMIVLLAAVSPSICHADDLDRALADLEALRAARPGAVYDDVPLAQVLTDLAQRSPVPIAGDFDALAGISIDRDDRVTIDGSRLALDDVLSGIAMQLGDEYDRPVFEYENGRIVLMSNSAASRTALTGVYDIRDLLHDQTTLQRLNAEQPPSTWDNRPAEETDQTPDAPAPTAETEDITDLDGAVDDHEQAPLRSPGVQLMELIAYHIDPDAWVEYGGSRAKISERDGVLLVTAPPTTHRRFRDALARLRHALPVDLTFDLSIIELDPDVPAGGTLTDDELMQRLERSGTSIWTSQSTIAIGRQASIETTARDAVIHVQLRPERIGGIGGVGGVGVLTLKVDAVYESGGNRDTIGTTIGLDKTAAARLLQLGGHHSPDSTRRYLKITPRQ